MALEHGRGLGLNNDTVINVVGLLKGQVGSTRNYALHLDAFPLDDELTAEGVTGEVRLTRLQDRILADVDARGRVELECVRCLRPYDQPFETAFTEEYRQMVDVRTGTDIPAELLTDTDADDEVFAIDENHELDVGEALRQWIVLTLPMRADCGPDCPGPDVTEAGEGEAVDERFAALSRLLDEDGAEH